MLSDISLNVTELAKRGLINASNFVTLKRHSFTFESKLRIRPKFSTIKVQRQESPVTKFQICRQVELHVFKAEKLDACIRSLFTNPVTNIVYHYIGRA